MTTFFCPRRGPGSPFDPQSEGTDWWVERADPYDIAPTCSYCGSVSPEVLFAAIEAGHELGPTDKGYKLYLELPNDMPGAKRVNGSSSGGDQSRPPLWGTNNGGYWVRRQDMNVGERELAIACGMHRAEDDGRDGWINFGPAGPIKHGKFYFQHFSADDRARFLDLHNEQKIALGYPGYLYAKPYFAREVSGG